MKFFHTILLTFFFVAPMLAQEQQVQQATDTQVQNGIDVRRYVNPRQYLQFMTGAGGPTNGITQGQFTLGLNSGTNNASFSNLTANGTTSLSFLELGGAWISNNISWTNGTSTAVGLRQKIEQTPLGPQITLDNPSRNGSGTSMNTLFKADRITASVLLNGPISGVNVQDGTLPFSAADTSWPVGNLGSWIIATNPANGELIISNSLWGATWVHLKTNNVPGFPGSISTGDASVGALSAFSAQIVGGVTNNALSASADVESDANKKLVSLGNGAGVKTNNGSGGIGWASSLDGSTIANGTLSPGAASSGWPASTNYISTTNLTSSLNQVPLSLGTTNAFGSQATKFGNLPFTACNFVVASNAFTNVVIGYFRVTNSDGLVLCIPAGTNLP